MDKLLLLILLVHLERSWLILGVLIPMLIRRPLLLILLLLVITIPYPCPRN